ncbi:MAG: phosphoribosylanthranilate isomerase [Candidatus Omnitrophica bacterium]|nr:phosphoribosylanthranilate isomerase [Candidatus Omnitrophota bacterium]
MVKVKICGITDKADALAAADYGCDGLGFIFYKKSPRYISPGKAREIISALPPRVVKIGVFVNNREKSIKAIARECRLDMLQFSGSETPEFCRRFKNFKVIKAFKVKNKINSAQVLRYRTFAYLFDTFSPGYFGGTGKTFNWKFLASDLSGLKSPIFLAGGLNEKNVLEAVKTVNPAWVDASSSLETSPGKKDLDKVKRFIARAKFNSSFFDLKTGGWNAQAK